MQEVTTKREDCELAALAQSGNRDAEEELLRRYLRLVRSIVRRFWGCGDAEDLLQTGMIGLCRAIKEYKAERGAFGAFARVCVERYVRSEVRAYQKKGNRALNEFVQLAEEEVVSSERDALDMLIRAENGEETKKRMQDVLSKLEYRVATLYYDGFSVSEICLATGLNVKSVDNALQRGKKKLKNSFARRAEKEK